MPWNGKSRWRWACDNDARQAANTLWAYATMGREPNADLMRGLEERGETLATTFNSQNVSNTL